MKDIKLLLICLLLCGCTQKKVIWDISYFSKNGVDVFCEMGIRADGIVVGRCSDENGNKIIGYDKE